MADKYEKFVRWYLRFNGYFTVDNFIVHAGDDPKRITYKGVVEPYTEVDILGVRMPYSREESGKLSIANHAPLVDGADSKFDVVIAEAKSGKNNSPNSVWQKQQACLIEYIVRFVGLYNEDHDIERISSELAEKYVSGNSTSRVRYVVFSNEVDKHWQDQGVTYITFEQIIRFLVEIRGQCWIESGIGVASKHGQWEPMINQIFAIANDPDLSLQDKIEKALDLLKQT